MAASQWLNIILCIMVFQFVQTIYFLDDEMRRSEIVDGTDFFKSIERDLKGRKRTDIMSGGSTWTFGDSWCNLTLSISSGTITATVVRRNGCTPPSIKRVLDHHFQSNNFDTAIRILDGDEFGVESIRIVNSSGLLTMDTKVYDNLPLQLFGLLPLGGSADTPTVMEFSWLSNEVMTLNNTEIKLEGVATLGPHEVEMEIIKPFTKQLFEIVNVTSSDTIEVANVTRQFHINLADIARGADKFNFGWLMQAQWRDWFGYGAFNAEGDFQIVIEHVTADGDNEPIGLNGASFKLVLSRFDNIGGAAGAPYSALFVRLPAGANLSETSKHFLLKENLENIPMFSRPANRPWCITVAPQKVQFMDTEMLQDGPGILCASADDGEKVCSGPGCNIKYPIESKETLRGCGAAENEVQDIPDELTLSMAMGLSKIKNKIPSRYNTPVGATLKCMGVDGTPDFLSIFFGGGGEDAVFKLIDFGYTPADKEDENSKAQFNLAFELTLPEGYRKIPNTEIAFETLEASISTNNESGWEFSAQATLKLHEIEVSLLLEKVSNNWKFLIEIPSMTLRSILDLFENVNCPETGISELDNWGIKDFKFEWNFGGTTIVRFSGNPILFGYDGAHLEAIYWKPTASGQPTHAFAFAILFEHIDLEWIFQKVSKSSRISVKWLKNLSAVIAVSNAKGEVSGNQGSEADSSSRSSLGKRKSPSSHTSKSPKGAVQDPLYKKIIPHIKRHTASHKKLNSHDKNDKQKKKLHKKTADEVSTRNSHKKTVRNDDDEDEPSLDFDIDMPDTTIRPGLTFAISYKLPEETEACFENKLCLWMQEKLPNLYLQIGGYIGPGKVELSASISTAVVLVNKEDTKLTLTDVIFQIRVGLDNPGLRLECRLKYENKDLSDDEITFMGAIEIGFTGSIALEFAMGGIIERPFGSEYLAFGNIYLRLGISIGFPLPSLEFAAELCLGQRIEDDPRNNEHVITIQAAFGINPNNPKDFWVYAQVNALTIQKICDAFQLNCDIPSSIGDSGFPEGVTLSYSLEERSIEVINLEVQAGFFLKGKIKIFDLEASGHVLINKEEFDVDIRMAPLNWVGGLIKVQRNSEDSQNGPICKIKAGADEFEVHIEGYAELLGISGGIKIWVSNTGFEFEVNGTMWPGIFFARVELKASYASIDTLSFSIVVEVRTTDFMLKLKEAIVAFCEKAGEAAQIAFDNAKVEMTAAQGKVNETIDKVNGYKGDVSAWQAKLRQRHAELERRKSQMQTDCKSKCPKICFGFLDWNSHCWKFWGHWVGCLFWNSCFSMIEDIFCMAGCELSKFFKKVLVWFEQLGIKIALAMGEIAKGLLTMANGVLVLANKVIDFAKDVVDFVNLVVQGALWALKKIAEGALELFNLRELKLYATMDSDFNACVGYKIDVTIFGHDIKGDGEACLRLGFLDSLVNRVTDDEDTPLETKGISQTEKKLDEAEAKKKTVQDAEKEMKDAEKEAEKEIDDETAKRYDEEMNRKRGTIPHPDTIEFIKKLPKRTSVPTEEEMKYIKAAEEPLPDHTIGREETIAAFASHPWFNPKDIPLFGMSSLPIKDDTAIESKRTLLDFESDMNPCERMKRALQNYEGVTDGLITSSNSIWEQRAVLENMTINDRSKIESIKAKIQDLEKRHNLTDEERADAYFWHNKLDQGLNDFTKRSVEAINRQDSYALPILRNQLNHMLKTEKGSTVLKFTDLLHQNAVQGYKRSIIPKHESDDGEKTLLFIKRDLEDVLNNVDDSLTNQDGRLQVLRSNIQSMKKHVHTCEHN